MVCVLVTQVRSHQDHVLYQVATLIWIISIPIHTWCNVLNSLIPSGSDCPSAVLIHKPVERILIRYDQTPRDFTQLPSAASKHGKMTSSSTSSKSATAGKWISTLKFCWDLLFLRFFIEIISFLVEWQLVILFTDNRYYNFQEAKLDYRHSFRTCVNILSTGGGCGPLLTDHLLLFPWP